MDKLPNIAIVILRQRVFSKILLFWVVAYSPEDKRNEIRLIYRNKTSHLNQTLII